MSISFSKTCPECGAPTEPEGDHRRCVECEWDSAEPTLFQDTESDATQQQKEGKSL
jgi:hypothetical protein